MKKIVFILIIAFSVLHLFAAEKVDFIVAKVGREIILFSDLLKQINQMKGAKMWDDNMSELLVLTDMIENKLIVQKARELNIRVDEKRIKSTADNQINQIKEQFPSEDQFFRELRSAGLLLSDLRKYYEDMLTEQFLRDRLIQTEIRSKINLTDSQVFDFYQTQRDSIPLREQSYELAMILRIPGPSEETNQQALDKINAIKNRLQKGDDFEKLAREFSECPSSQSGGDLGFFSRGMMVKEFEDTAFNLSINQISDVVKTSFGYHLIKVTDKKDNDVKASHILVMLTESPDDIDRERNFMQDLVQRIESGESFANLATQYTHDKDSQNNNGIIGVLTRKEFPHWFSEELSSLQVGQTSTVLEYQNMFYLFTIYQSFEPRPLEFTEIRDNLKELLMKRKQLELYEQWMNDLRKEIFVQVYEDRLNVSE